MILSEGIYVDPQKIEAVVKWEQLINVIEVRSFLDLASHYHSFVKGFSKIAISLTQSINKNAKLQWDNDCEKSFQELKSRLTSTTVFILSFGNERFMVYTDASRQGLSCVLMQHRNGVAYASRQLKKYEQSYLTYDLDQAIVVFTFKT